ncbi:MAG: hypothetical protein K2X82_12215 [Gemmataceae bacterium]|nr:hypothetical protein [Gemmataceae bacterium]
MRTFALAVLVGSLASAAAAARDDDPIREKLDKAKADYLAAVEKVKELVEKPFADAEDKARAKADQKKLDELKEAREAFDGWHDIPDGIPFAESRAKLAQARKSVIDAHKTAIKAYQKANNRNDANTVVKELNQLQEGWDALTVGSVWTGRVGFIYQGDPKGFKSDATLTVIDRQGAQVTFTVESTAADGKAQKHTLEGAVGATGRFEGKAWMGAKLTGKVSAERFHLSLRRPPGAGVKGLSADLDVTLRKR